MRNARNEIGTSAHLELRLAGLHDTAPIVMVLPYRLLVL